MLKKRAPSYPRFEVQVRHHTAGWTGAGHWPARTVTEGLESLQQCAAGVDGHGSVHDYRLVRLMPRVIATRPATKSGRAKRR